MSSQAKKKSKTSKSAKKGSSTAFGEVLYEIISDEATDEWIRWTDDGESFVVLSPHMLEKHVFGKYFRHKRFPSFQRQLYTYCVKRLETIVGDDGETSFVFSHPALRRGHPELLEGLVRRASTTIRERERDRERERERKKASGGRGAEGGGRGGGGGGAEKSELDSLVHKWGLERETLWREIAGLHDANGDLARQVEELETDNAQLWALVQAQEEAQELLKQGLKALFLHVAGSDGVGSMSAVEAGGQWTDMLFDEGPGGVSRPRGGGAALETVVPLDGGPTTHVLGSGGALAAVRPRKRKMEAGRMSPGAGRGMGAVAGAGEGGEASGVEARRMERRVQDRQGRYAPLRSPKLSDITLFGPPSTWSAAGGGGPSATALVSTHPTGSTSSFKRNLGLAADYVFSSLDARASEREGLIAAYQQRRAAPGAPLGVNLGSATGTVSEVYNEAAGRRAPDAVALHSPRALFGSGADDDGYSLAIDLDGMEGIEPALPTDVGLHTPFVPSTPLPGTMDPSIGIPIPQADADELEGMSMSPVSGLSHSFSELRTT